MAQQRPEYRPRCTFRWVRLNSWHLRSLSTAALQKRSQNLRPGRLRYIRAVQRLSITNLALVRQSVKQIAESNGEKDGDGELPADLPGPPTRPARFSGWSLMSSAGADQLMSSAAHVPGGAGPRFLARREFAGRPDQVRTARWWLSRMISGQPVAHDVVLACSELASNAILHS